MPGPPRIAYSFPLILLLLRRLHEAYLRFEENEYPIWPQLEFVRFVKPGHATVLLSTCPFFRRNDRQQQIRRLGAAKMKARNAVKNRWWPIAGIVMQERTAASQLILEVRQPAAARPAIFVVLAAD